MFCLPVPPLIYLWEIYIFPGSVCLLGCREICGPILGKYKSLTTLECGNWDWGRAIPRKGIQYIKGIFLAVQSHQSGSSRLCRLRFLCRRQAKRKTGAFSSLISFKPRDRGLCRVRLCAMPFKTNKFLSSTVVQDQKSRDLHEKSRDLSNYEIFQHKILKSQSFKKRAVYWYFYATLNIFSYTGDNLEIKSLDLHGKSLDLSNYWQKTAECRKCAETFEKNPPKTWMCACWQIKPIFCIASIDHW